VHVLIGVEDGAQDTDLIDLYGWLRDTREVTHSAKVELRPGRQSDSMSAGDLIVVVATAVSALTGVVQAYAAWRASRPTAPAIVVTLKSGATVSIAKGSAEELAALLRAAEQDGEETP
jgi:Effector Associated Constant Component 1